MVITGDLANPRPGVILRWEFFARIYAVEAPVSPCLFAQPLSMSRRLSNYKMATFHGFRSIRIVSALLFLFVSCIGLMLSFQQIWLQRIGVRVDLYTCKPCASEPSPVSLLEAKWLQIQHEPSDRGPSEDNVHHQTLIAIDPNTLPVGPTSVNSTTFKLVSPQSPRVGDTLHFHIEARNVEGKRIWNGGDFWFGVLESPELKAATAARIIDHHNGTYSMYFLASWSGQARIRITLVHPSAAIHYLRNTFCHAEKKVLWKGVFTRGTVVEKSSCWINYLGNASNTCAYQAKRALQNTQLLCNRPASLPCTTLSGVVGATSYRYQFERVLTKDKAHLFNKAYVNAPLESGRPITIKETIDGRAILDPKLFSPPTCKPDLPRTLSDGFWYNDHWQSLVCQPHVSFSETNLRKCLKGQNIYLTGDSTTRQWFAEIAKTLKLSKKEDNQFKNKSFHLQRTDTKSNIRLEFIFHPLSLHPSTVFVNLSVVQFEADVLYSLAKTPCQNAIVVISPWAHFPNYPWGSYIDWLEGIRNAYSHVKRTCRNVKLIVKTPHPVNMQWEMKGRDWMFYQMKEAMWKVFQESGAFFVDVWDMNLSYPSSSINMHMPADVIKEEISLFLSYACQS